MQRKFPVHVTFPFIAHSQTPRTSWLCHTPQGWSWDDEHGCLSGGSLLIIIMLRRHRLGNCMRLCHQGIFGILASCGMADEVRIHLWLQKGAGMLYIDCLPYVLPETRSRIFPVSVSLMRRIWHHTLSGSGSDVSTLLLQADAEGTFFHMQGGKLWSGNKRN